MEIKTGGIAQWARSNPRKKLSPGPGLNAEEVAAHQLARIHRAMIEIIAERGYVDLKVRDLVTAAGVSSRAFYEHFSSKEDCFLKTYELISRRVTQRVIAAQADEPSWQKRPGLMLAAFARELTDAPNAARLTLVEAYSAAPTCLERVWQTERIFGGMLAESFARAPGGVAVPPLLVEGMVGGIARVARARLINGRFEALRQSSDELVKWALCYPNEAAAKLEDLDGQSVGRNRTLESPVKPSGSVDRSAWQATGDRALILSAVAKLATANGYANLTVPKIRAAAGVSRRKFDAYFDGVEDCYVAALEQRAAEIFGQIARAQTAGRSWSGGLYRAIVATCDHVGSDAFLANACLISDFPPGSLAARSRQRLATAIAGQLSEAVPRELRVSAIADEASAGAVWTVFRRQVVQEWALRRRVSATLAYLALAPVLSASAALTAISEEQFA